MIGIDQKFTLKKEFALAGTIDIDSLIKIVASGGKVTTGIDIYNNNGVLLLDKTFVVTSTKTLQKIGRASCRERV